MALNASLVRAILPGHRRAVRGGWLLLLRAADFLSPSLVAHGPAECQKLRHCLQQAISQKSQGQSISTTRSGAHGLATVVHCGPQRACTEAHAAGRQLSGAQQEHDLGPGLVARSESKAARNYAPPT